MNKNELSDQETAQRDKLLLRLLKTPPQPRPKRERDKSEAARKPPRPSKSTDKR